jgi:hypothetical protein
MQGGQGCSVYIFDRPQISSDVMQIRNLGVFLVYETDLFRFFVMAQQDRRSRLQSQQQEILAQDLLKIGKLLTKQCIRVVELCPNGASGRLVKVMHRQD